MSADSPVAIRSAISWFEIPVTDFDRAVRFYEAIFETTLQAHAFGTGRGAVFPYERPGGGCLDEGSASKPGTSGIVIYLDATDRLDRTLDLAARSGGRVELPRTELPNEMGYIAHFLDSEGNRIGLHSIT